MKRFCNTMMSDPELAKLMASVRESEDFRRLSVTIKSGDQLVIDPPGITVSLRQSDRRKFSLLFSAPSVINIGLLRGGKLRVGQTTHDLRSLDSDHESF